MLTSLYQRFEHFLGRGAASVTIPPMDGALKPNNLLEGARSLAPGAEPDNLTIIGDDALFTTGSTLFRVATGQWLNPTVIARFERRILAMAASPGGAVAVSLDGAGVRLLGGDYDRKVITSAAGRPLDCVVALAFSGEGVVVACNGSSRNRASEWQRDLLESESAGSVWSLDLVSGGAMLVADDLGFPYGVLVHDDDGAALIAESWKSRLLSVDLRGFSKPNIVFEGLPGYPSRLAPRAGGGAWLAVFAPRSQLIEFVIRETAYRRAMMAEVDRDFWIAPALFSGRSFSEPMQGGALKQMGVLKPWAPTRSYGLVVELDSEFAPVASLHSRAGGRRHGITSCQQVGGELLMTSRGGDELIVVRVDASSEPRNARS